ncbi:MAG: PAS domain S-box protein [Candidatus Yonathbacteria bacterium]|nr:PAS domain S-box protein [Candidatus Yonathbacteria bacterium]
MKRLPLPATIALIILPLILAGVYFSIREFNHQTNVALERRAALADLSALLVHEKFDGIVDVGMSLASRQFVYQNIEKGNWDGAMENMQGILQTFPYLDNVLFFDKEGILKASNVPSPEMIGKDFSYRNYYQGVSKEWKPYVSEAFLRAVEPKYGVVSVAVPVKSADQKILGIILLAIKLDKIVDWIKEIDIGSGGYVFVVDKKGQLVVHPNIVSEDVLTDFSSVPVVQKILKGEHGTGIFFDTADNDEDMVAYSPVKEYGYGVMVAQPTRIAFAERDRQVIELALIWALLAFIVGFSSYRVLKDRERIKKQRDRERILLESIGDGIVVIDRNWHITLWNKSASVITGFSEAEALGKPFREIIKFIRERDRKEDVAFIEDAIVMKKTSFMEDGVLLVRKDGSEILVGDSAAPLINADGETEGAIIVFRDASKEHESKHLRSDFMYATHQLRTPVTEALWNLETAIDEENPEKKKEGLQIAHQSLLSIKNLSEDLVTVSEIDQKTIMAHRTPTKLIDVLTEMQEKLLAEAKARNVTIVIAPVSPLMAVNTDQKLLTRVLFEIVENAVTYGPQGSTVDVTTMLHEKEICIEVADHGFGIPEEEQVTIFTKFFRGSNRGKENAGDGLGLYIAKAYIELLGGKIWFKSEEGKGTTFYITLPIE